MSESEHNAAVNGNKLTFKHPRKWNDRKSKWAFEENVFSEHFRDIPKIKHLIASYKRIYLKTFGQTPSDYDIYTDLVNRFTLCLYVRANCWTESDDSTVISDWNSATHHIITTLDEDCVDGYREVLPQNVTDSEGTSLQGKIWLVKTTYQTKKKLSLDDVFERHFQDSKLSSFFSLLLYSNEREYRFFFTPDDFDFRGTGAHCFDFSLAESIYRRTQILLDNRAKNDYLSNFSNDIYVHFEPDTFISLGSI
ncbi:hypothetical protein LJC64_03990 [Ruminococcaceae bacterium OttesenSCG-928-A11]|nr:hypothetical protein [Ruminococcaceae bacterium OttesenSCG-928-A11]